MTKKFQTPQEEFWAGDFGNEYSRRNTDERWVASNTVLFSRILAKCHAVGSMIEFGSNIGLNLKAVRTLLPQVRLTAIEINASAVEQLRSWGGANEIHHGSIFDFKSDATWDLALIKGVLVHVNPDFLPRVYESLYRASGRYIAIAEYYNPTPVEVVYRGHSGRLFKRDFAGEMLDAYPKLRLVDYGFSWHRDPLFPQDDCNWFLLEKA